MESTKLNFALPVLLLTFSLLMGSCGSRDKGVAQDVVLCQYIEEEEFDELETLFHGVEIIKLDTANAAYLSPQSEMVMSGDNYFIVDKEQGKIFRYGVDGKFLNTIGQIGRGDKEFLQLSSLQIIGDTLQIYSGLNDALFRYDFDGQFLGSIDTKISAWQVMDIDGELFCYLGYGNGQHDERIIVTDRNGQLLQKYLPSTANILSFLEPFHPMTLYNDSIFVRETYSNQITAICADQSIASYLKFDFGKYNIPKECFEVSDPFKAVELLLGSDFASIYKFLHNDKYNIVEVQYQFVDQDKGGRRMVGISSGDQWYWIASSEVGDNALFYDGLKMIDQNNRLVVLSDVGTVSDFAKRNPKLFGDSNHSRYEASEMEDPVLLLFQLK